MTNFHPIASAPIDRVIIVKRGATLARARWHRDKTSREGGMWIYDVPEGGCIEQVDFAPTHWRELQPAKKKKETAHVNA